MVRGRVKLSRMRALVDQPVTFRKRESEDSPTLERLIVEAFSEYSPDRGKGAVRLLAPLETIVACRGDSVIGFAALEVIRTGVMAVQALAVTESERGRGVGQRLLEAVERVARDRKCRFLCLHTAEANLAAFALFIKSGFEVERRIPRYYRGVFDACEMVKVLPVHRRR